MIGSPPMLSWRQPVVSMAFEIILEFNSKVSDHSRTPGAVYAVLVGRVTGKLIMKTDAGRPSTEK